VAKHRLGVQIVNNYSPGIQVIVSDSRLFLVVWMDFANDESDSSPSL
jgi:hypothetical protein